jgi:hypothetical protein
MIRARRVAHIVVFCLITTLGYSQSFDSEYVAPAHPVPEAKLQA